MSQTSATAIRFWGVLALTLVFLNTPALAATSIVSGEACTALGASLMTTDQKSIVTCLKNDSGSLVWKSMSGGDGSPTGAVAYFYLAACPSGWTLANGANGTLDLRGEFIRVADNGRGVDAGRAVGSTQSDAIRNITGTVTNALGGGLNSFPLSSSGALYATTLTVQGADPSMHGPDFVLIGLDASRVVPTASENRPRNVALIACQKT